MANKAGLSFPITNLLENRLHRLLEISSRTEHQLRSRLGGAFLQLRDKRTPNADLPGKMRPRNAFPLVHG